MLPDQAAGLRRRRGEQPLRCIHCCFGTGQSTVRLARALHGHGWTSLLVDAYGRVPADSPARSLFDWRQQLARGHLHTVPVIGGEAWQAPGLRADAPGLAQAARNYDCLLLDAPTDAPDWAAMPEASQIAVFEVQDRHASLLQTYAGIKAAVGLAEPCQVMLVGDVAACGRLLDACRVFLPPDRERLISIVASDIDAIAGLAVRMADEETGRRARYTTGRD